MRTNQNCGDIYIHKNCLTLNSSMVLLMHVKIDVARYFISISIFVKLHKMLLHRVFFDYTSNKCNYTILTLRLDKRSTPEDYIISFLICVAYCGFYTRMRTIHFIFIFLRFIQQNKPQWLEGVRVSCTPLRSSTVLVEMSVT